MEELRRTILCSAALQVRSASRRRAGSPLFSLGPWRPLGCGPGAGPELSSGCSAPRRPKLVPRSFPAVPGGPAGAARPAPQEGAAQLPRKAAPASDSAEEAPPSPPENARRSRSRPQAPAGRPGAEPRSVARASPGVGSAVPRVCKGGSPHIGAPPSANPALVTSQTVSGSGFPLPSGGGDTREPRRRGPEAHTGAGAPWFSGPPEGASLPSTELVPPVLRGPALSLLTSPGRRGAAGGRPRETAARARAPSASACAPLAPHDRGSQAPPRPAWALALPPATPTAQRAQPLPEPRDPPRASPYERRD